MSLQITLSDTTSQMMYQKNLATVGALTLSDAEKLLAMTDKSDEMALVSVKETIEDSEITIQALKEQIAQLYATVGNLSNENAALKGQYKTLSLSQEATVVPMKEEIAAIKKANEDLKNKMAEERQEAQKNLAAAIAAKETAVNDALKLTQRNTDALIATEQAKASRIIAALKNESEREKDAIYKFIEKSVKSTSDFFDSQIAKQRIHTSWTSATGHTHWTQQHVNTVVDLLKRGKEVVNSNFSRLVERKPDACAQQ